MEEEAPSPSRLDREVSPPLLVAMAEAVEDTASSLPDPTASRADEQSGSIPCQAPPFPIRQANALALWLEQQLQEERALLMDRHQALCDVMRRNLGNEAVAQLDNGQTLYLPLAHTLPELDVSNGARIRDEGFSGELLQENELSAGGPSLLASEVAAPWIGDAPSAKPRSTGHASYLAEGGVSRTRASGSRHAAFDLPDVANYRGEETSNWTGVGSTDHVDGLNGEVRASDLDKEAIANLSASEKEMMHQRRNGNSLIGFHVLDNTAKCGVTRWVQSWNFEIFFSGLIVLSSVVMALQVQFEGVALAVQSGMEPTSAGGSNGWPGAVYFFKNIEYIFGTFFTVEIVLKMVALRAAFWKAIWNILDFMIVAQFLLGLTVDLSLPFNPMVLRVCRLIRLVRLVKFLNMFEVFDTLALLVSSIKASASTCFWCSLLLCVVHMVFALVFNAVLLDHMVDPDRDPEFRTELFKFFGSFTRSMVTMFEVTLGNWVVVCRFLSENVSEWWGLVFISYKCIVGFAVLKVMTGVFLSQTFKVAAQDDELMIQTKERQQTYFRQKMQKFLRAADVSNRGYINLHQFKAAVEEPRVKLWLHGMDMQIQDASEVFAFIAGDASFRSSRISVNSLSETVVSVDDLCRGIGRLKGAAQQVDMLTLMAECRCVRSELSDVRRRLNRSCAVESES